jgi:hypothetical protein
VSFLAILFYDVIMRNWNETIGWIVSKFKGAKGKEKA